MAEPNSTQRAEDDLTKSLDKRKEDLKELKAKIEQEKRRLDLPVDSNLGSRSDWFPTGISTFPKRTITSYGAHPGWLPASAPSPRLRGEREEPKT